MTKMRAYDWVAFHARVRGHAIAMIDLLTGERRTYAEMDGRTEALAAALADRLGVTAGDRVAVLSRNSPNTFEVQFACARIGAIIVPLNWRLTGSELSEILKDAGPVVLIHDRESEAAALEMWRDQAGPRIAWTGPSEGAPDYEALLSEYAGQVVERVEPDFETVLGLLYTSGTTGLPKGVSITHAMVFWSALNISEPYSVGPGSVNFVGLPLFHTGGFNVLANPVFYQGGTNVLLPTFDPQTVLRAFSDPELGITHFVGVPTQFQMMAQLPEFETADLSRLVGVGVGGAPVGGPLLRRWLDKGVAIQEAYALSENGPMVMAQRKHDTISKPGSAGLPGLHLECKLVDAEGALVIEPGVVGEIVVRGPSVTPGYWNKPELTVQTIKDGWLHTGDAAKRDEDGYYYIVDRWKDMYRSGGENVYPAEVERVLFTLDGVAEAAVIGVPDELWTEVGMAFIVTAPGHEISDDAIVAHCRERLAKFKIPKHFAFVQEIPKNGTGKIAKTQLRAIAQATRGVTA